MPIFPQHKLFSRQKMAKITIIIINININESTRERERKLIELRAYKCCIAFSLPWFFFLLSNEYITVLLVWHQHRSGWLWAPVETTIDYEILFFWFFFVVDAFLGSANLLPFVFPLISLLNVDCIIFLFLMPQSHMHNTCIYIYLHYAYRIRRM